MSIILLCLLTTCISWGGVACWACDSEGGVLILRVGW